MNEPDLPVEGSAALLARLQRECGDWRSPGSVPAYDQALAMTRLHQLPAALELLDRNSDPGPAERLLRIHLLLRLGQPGPAGALLRSMDHEDPAIAPRRRIRQEIDWLEQDQGVAAALAAVEGHRQRYPRHEPFLLQHLKLLAAADPLARRWLELVRPLLRAGLTPGLLLPVLDQLIRYNRMEAALRLVLPQLEAEAPNPHLLERGMAVAWHNQDAGLLDRLAAAALRLEQPYPGVLRFARERAELWPQAPILLESAAVWLAEQPEAGPAIDDPEMASRLSHLARLAALTGAPGRGADWLADLLRVHPFLVRERLLRAELLAQDGQVAAAEAELALVLAEAPHLGRAYALACKLLDRRPDALDETDALLKRRARLVAEFRPAAGPATLPPYDVDRYGLEMRRGAVGQALWHRSGRPANHYLAALLPHSYAGLHRPVLQPGARVGRIGILAWEGISDEVRLAQAYALLPGQAESVVISCEPRLQTLLARSFPDIAFHPLRRRWPLLWQDRPILREAIHERVLSGYLDRRFLAQLQGCDLVLFSDEITGQMHLYQPERWQAHRQVAAQGYLVPDPARRALWAERFGSGRPLVGLLWRSALQSHSRNPHYLALEELLPLVAAHPAHRWVALQPHITAEERALCSAHGILLPEGLDLFHDIEGIAACVSVLDLVVGISSLPFELAAATGVPVWMLALTPEGLNKRQRPDGADQMTVNGRVFGPGDLGNFADRCALLDDLLGQIGRGLIERQAAATARAARPAGPPGRAD